MERTKAEKNIRTYRAQVRSWNLVLAGVSLGNLDEIERWLDDNRSILESLKDEYPDWAPTIDALVTFRERLQYRSA